MSEDLSFSQNVELDNTRVQQATATELMRQSDVYAADILHAAEIGTAVLTAVSPLGPELGALRLSIGLKNAMTYGRLAGAIAEGIAAPLTGRTVQIGEARAIQHIMSTTAREATAVRPPGLPVPTQPFP